jgi:hypothetical protein
MDGDPATTNLKGMSHQRSFSVETVLSARICASFRAPRASLHQGDSSLCVVGNQLLDEELASVKVPTALLHIAYGKQQAVPMAALSLFHIITQQRNLPRLH